MKKLLSILLFLSFLFCLISPVYASKESDAKRIFGDNRYDTAFKVADELKATLGVDKFENVNDWGKTILDIKVTSDCKDPIQCSVEELRKEWIIDITANLNKLEDIHDGTGGRNKLKNLDFYK